MRKQHYLTALAFILLAFSCKKEGKVILEETLPVELNFTATFGNEPFVTSKWYPYDEKTDINFNNFSFYISNIVLLKDFNSGGDAAEIKEIEILDFSNFTDETVAEKGLIIPANQAPIGDYVGVKFGIGVVSDLNRTKPAEYSSTHPLGIPNAYHFDWNSYMFTTVDAVLDFDQDEIADENIFYQSGTDKLYREKIIFQEFSLKGKDTYVLKFKLDVKRLFGTPDQKIDVVSNPTDENFKISTIISDNFENAILLE